MQTSVIFTDVLTYYATAQFSLPLNRLQRSHRKPLYFFGGNTKYPVALLNETGSTFSRSVMPLHYGRYRLNGRQIPFHQCGAYLSGVCRTCPL